MAKASNLRLFLPTLAHRSLSKPTLQFQFQFKFRSLFTTVIASSSSRRHRNANAPLHLTRRSSSRESRKRRPPMEVEERNSNSNSNSVGFNKRRAEGRDKSDASKKNLQLKLRKLNPVNTISYLQILGTGFDTQDTSPSLLLFFDKQRFIFNAGEVTSLFSLTLTLTHSIILLSYYYYLLSFLSLHAYYSLSS